MEHRERVSVPPPTPTTTEQQQQPQIPPPSSLTPIYCNLSGDEIQAGYFYSVYSSYINPEWPEFLNRNRFILVVEILPEAVKIQYSGESDHDKFEASFKNGVIGVPGFSYEWLMTTEQAKEMLNKRIEDPLKGYADHIASYWE